MWTAFDVLASTLTKNTIDLIYICGQLKQRMLVVESEHDGVLGYSLAHERIKQVLTRQQSPSARRILHLRVAQYLESKEGHGGYRPYDRLVYHYSAGGNRFKTFQYRVLSLNAYAGLFYSLMPTLHEIPGMGSPENDRVSDEIGELEEKNLRAPELEALWPADPREHCRWCLSCLSGVKNADRERLDTERELEQLENT